MKPLKKKVLIISPQTWTHFFNSKHHYSITLDKAGYDVYFLNPISYLFSKQFNTCEISRNKFNINIVKIKIFCPKALIKLYKNFFNFFFKLSIFFSKNFFNTNFDLVWCFDEKNYNLIHFFKSNKKILQIMDPMSTQISTSKLNKIDYIVTISKKLLKISNYKNIIYTTHGLSKFFINRKKTRIIKSSKKTIGFYGNFLSGRFNLNCINKIIKKNPSLLFIFFGNTDVKHPYANNEKKLKIIEEIKILKKNSNTIFYENVPLKLLTKYLDRCDLFLYVSSLKNNIDAHKLLELIYLGKPIITSKFLNYKNTKDILYHPTTNSSWAFSKQIALILLKKKYYYSNRLKNKRINFALEKSYENITRNLLEKFNG